MKQVEKTVFISYRRTNKLWAIIIQEHLRNHDYDVYWDYKVRSGAFEPILLNKITQCAHFILIVTPSALERCKDPNSVMHKEVERAIDSKRNIVPLRFDGVELPEIEESLTGKLQILTQYNMPPVSTDFYDGSMKMLRECLDIDLKDVVHPSPYEVTAEEQVEADKVFQQAKIEIEITPLPTMQQLDTEVLFEQGVAAAMRKDFVLAEKIFDNVVDVDPKNATAFYNRGVARRILGNYEGAIDDNGEAIKLKPDYAEAHNNRGVARHQQGDYEGAISDFNNAIEFKLDYAEAYNNKGASRHYQGNFTCAIADFDEAIKLKPDYAESFSNRGLTRGILGDFDGAIDDFDQTLKYDKNNFNALNGLGLMCSYQGDYKKARRYYKKAHKIDKKALNTLYNLAVVAIRQWSVIRADKAVNKVQRRIEKLQESAKGRELGQICYATGGLAALAGDYDSALDWLEKALPLMRDAAGWAQQDIAWDVLREDERFLALVGRD
jgi:tetratricopeptide (TPR) repeat protein